MSTRRAYRNGQLVDGFDMAGEFDNLGKQPLVEQASLSSMRLPQRSQDGTSMKGFRVFVKIKRT